MACRFESGFGHHYPCGFQVIASGLSQSAIIFPVRNSARRRESRSKIPCFDRILPDYQVRRNQSPAPMTTTVCPSWSRAFRISPLDSA